MKYFSIFLTKAVHQNSLLFIGFNSIVVTPIRFPPSISVKIWSPTIQVSSVEVSKIFIAFLRFFRIGFLALKIYGRFKSFANSSTLLRLLFETRQILKPWCLMFSSQRMISSVGKSTSHPTSVLSISMINPLILRSFNNSIFTSTMLWKYKSGVKIFKLSPHSLLYHYDFFSRTGIINAVIIQTTPPIIPLKEKVPLMR